MTWVYVWMGCMYKYSYKGGGQSSMGQHVCIAWYIQIHTVAARE